MGDVVEMGARSSRQGTRGLTLIELLVTLVIIAIILAVAVPLLLKSRTAANEADAIGALKVFISAELTYRVENRRHGTLDELAGSNLVSPPLSTGKATGYKYEIVVDPSTWTDSWYAEAAPEAYANTGQNCFYVDESGVIRLRDTGGSAFVPRTDAENWMPIGN